MASQASADNLSLDFETRSAVDLRKAGAHVYAADSTTDIWVASFAFNDEPVQRWYPGRPLSNRFIDHLAGGGRVSGWNVGFERLVIQHIAVPRYGWPQPKLQQFHDTAAAAAAAALPRALENAAIAIRARFQKDMAGHRLMMQMAKPRHWLLADGTRSIKKVAGATPVFWDDPEKLERLSAYCALDVETERDIARRIRPLTEAERIVYLLDQSINDRGIRLDISFVQHALRVAEAASRDLDRRMKEVTGGAVPKASLVAKLKTWLAEHGVNASILDEAADEEDELGSLDKTAMKALLDCEMPEHCRQALEIRAEAARSSTRKLVSMLACCGEDERIRGLHLYHGASTGRWSGKLVQTQNFPKGDLKKSEYEPAIDDLMRYDDRQIDVLWGSPLGVIASTLRGAMIPSPGCRFIVCDFAAIEARVLAWLAGETKLVELFASGGDTYVHMASRIFARTVTKADFVERFIGKQTVLGCGYGMGPPKFIATCNKLAAEMKIDIQVDTALAELAVGAYRETNTAIVALWYEMNDAAMEAVRRPGVVTSAARGRIRFKIVGQFLYMILPSGRTLSYASPFVGKRMTPWGEERDGVRYFSVPSPGLKRKLSKADAALPGALPGRWEITDTYGGKWCENAVQAIARDLLTDAMLRLHRAGYKIVLTVHDETVSDAPIGFGSAEEVIGLTCGPLPAWAAGCPVAAEAFECSRYRKG